MLCHFHKNDKYIQSSWKTKGISHLNDHTSLVTQRVKDQPAMQRPGFDPSVERSPGERNGYPLQYSHLVSSTDKETWRMQSLGSHMVRHN